MLQSCTSVLLHVILFFKLSCHNKEHPNVIFEDVAVFLQLHLNSIFMFSISSYCVMILKNRSNNNEAVICAT